MKISLSFVRAFFVSLSLLFATAYTVTVLPGGFNFTNTIIGLFAGLIFSAFLVLVDTVFRGANLRTLNVILIGLLIGYLLGQGVVLVWKAAAALTGVELLPQSAGLIEATLFFVTIYFGIVLATKASEEFYFTIPFVKFKSTNQKKKDLLADSSILSESRILDLATSGLLDHYLIIPRFIMKDLYVMAESNDEGAKSKGKRSLEVLKKLEALPGLDLRYSEVDFPELGETSLKLIKLARQLDANIITAEINRFQQSNTDGIRIINIQILSNILKPITGEQLAIKIQRFGKESRQGVGYLEDGTMVVVNGGAEFMGATVKASVLSVKHTTSGRMIFCNVAEECAEHSLFVQQGQEADLAQKTYQPVG